MPLTNEMVSAGIQTHRAQAMLGGVATGLTAAGTNQATALALTLVANHAVTSAAASTGVRLPLGASLGDEVSIRNGGANAIAVYNPTGGNSTSLGSIAPNASSKAKCTAVGGLTWVLC